MKWKSFLRLVFVIVRNGITEGVKEGEEIMEVRLRYFLLIWHLCIVTVAALRRMFGGDAAVFSEHFPLQCLKLVDDFLCLISLEAKSRAREAFRKSSIDIIRASRFRNTQLAQRAASKSWSIFFGRNEALFIPIDIICGRSARSRSVNEFPRFIGWSLATVFRVGRRPRKRARNNWNARQ